MRSKLACLVALVLVGCGRPHGKSDGTAPPEMIKPDHQIIANMRVGETGCVGTFDISKERHVWLYSTGKVYHSGPCDWTDYSWKSTATRTKTGWYLYWRDNDPQELYDVDSNLERMGHFRVTELEW